MSDKPKKTVKVTNYIDTTRLKADLAYTPVNLSDAMMTQASLFAHYGELAAKASRQVDNLKLVLENTEAAVYRVIRDEVTDRGEKVTEGLLDKLVTRHERVINTKKALNEAKQIEAVAKTAVEAFRHRRDMLVQQGLIMREELKGEVAIGARNVREQEVEDLKERYLQRAQNRQSEAA
jgi:hypothetical protein